MAIYNKSRMRHNFSHQFTRLALAAAISLALVLGIDFLSNAITDLPWADWDFNHYMLMAERGLADNPELVAPFAYRPLTPLLAGWLMRAFGFSGWRAFKLLAYAGAVLNLLTLYWLLERAGARPRAALWAVTMIALGHYQVKFLLFDPFRPDHLAFPLINLAYTVLWSGAAWLGAGIVALGMLAREFLLLPIAGAMAAALTDKKMRAGAALAGTAGLAVLFGLRWLIPVSGHAEYVSFSSLDEAARALVSIPLDWRRTLNWLFCLLAYLLPLGMLLTARRWRAAWSVLGERRIWLAAHTALTLLLAMYGGTDLARFMVYLYLPLAFVLAGMLEHGQVRGAELALMLAAVLVFNRIPWPYPTASLEAYLDFYGGYHNHLSAASALRWAELAAWLAAGYLLRWGINKNRSTLLNQK